MPYSPRDNPDEPTVQPDSSHQHENLALSTGSEIVGDWSPSWKVQDPHRLSTLRDYVVETSAIEDPESLPSQWDGLLSLDALDDALSQANSCSTLSTNEFNAIAAGLCNTGAATEYEATSSYSSYTFAINTRQVKTVFDQWIIAAAGATAKTALNNQESPSVEIVATFPPDSNLATQSRIAEIDLSLRSIITQAEESIRVAAPYLDPDEDVIQDIACLPSQGVSSYLLTREATGPNTDSDTRKAIENLAASIPAGALHNFRVSDLYEETGGTQTEAVHAKSVIIDEQIGYLGSANFTSNSLGSNFEIGVVLEGDLVGDLVLLFDEMFDRGTKIQLK
jgi:hypothetical protein